MSLMLHVPTVASSNEQSTCDINPNPAESQERVGCLRHQNGEVLIEGSDFTVELLPSSGKRP
jgi:hypothetical protein